MWRKVVLVAGGVVVPTLVLLAAACGGHREAPAASSPPLPGDASVKLEAPAVRGQVAPAAAQTLPVEQPQSGAASRADRKILQSATLTLQVNEVGPAYEQVTNLAAANGGFVALRLPELRMLDDKVTNLAAANGGFVASARLSSDKEGKQTATVTLRVPVHRYEAVLSELRRLASKVEDEQAASNDATEEYTDLQARLRNLEATEAQYLEFLKQAKNLNEVLAVQDRLNTVRNEIERLKGRANLLDRLSDLATITVTLRPVSAPPTNEDGVPRLSHAVAKAWAASLRLLQTLAVGVVTVVVFSWWILPPLAALAFFVRNRLTRARTPVEGTPPS